MTGEPEKGCPRKGHSSADQGSAEEGVRHRGQEEQCSRQRDPELTLRDAKSKGECIGEGHGNPLQCSCLENPRDGRAWCICILSPAPLARARGLPDMTMFSCISRRHSRDRMRCNSKNNCPIMPSDAYRKYLPPVILAVILTQMPRTRNDPK